MDELKAYLLERNSDTNAIALLIDPLRRGDIVLVWQGALSDVGDASEKFLLGYEKNTPRSGGYMVTGGGFVRQISAEEFAEYKPLPKQLVSVPDDKDKK